MPDVCAECGTELEIDPWKSRTRFGPRFRSDKCGYRNRDRKRYEDDPEGQRARSRDYYAHNREKKLAAVKAYQARLRKERGPRKPLHEPHRQDLLQRPVYASARAGTAL